MIIKNAMVYTSDHRFEKKDIRIKDERIAEIAENGALEAKEEDVVDGAEMYAIPGLVDIHFHGAVGYDFCQASKEELLKIAEYEAKNGVLAICPATMSYNEEILGHIMDKAADYQEDTGADLVGINMEGPFIAPEKKGAQNVIVSMAGEGAVFVGSDGSVFTSEAPHGVVKNSVGAGDSMVAGFLAGYLAKGDYAEAFKMGLCTGSASAFSDQLATREEVEQVRRSHIFDFKKGELV